MRIPVPPSVPSSVAPRITAAPAQYYTVLMFETRIRALEFCRDVTATLRTADGMLRDAPGATLWMAATEFSDGSYYIYASDRALDAATAAGANFSIAGYVDHARLPRARCLVFGEVHHDGTADGSGNHGDR
jgi:hypothetical protein